MALATSTAQGQSIWREKRDTFNKSLIAAAGSECSSKSQPSVSCLISSKVQVHACASPENRQREYEMLVLSNKTVI